MASGDMSQTIDAPPRNLRLKPEVTKDLAIARAQLLRGVRSGWMTADDAMLAYNDVLAQVVRNPGCHVEDTRAWTAVKCRRCGRETSVPLEIDIYNCRCTPSVKRFLATDMIGLDGEYAVDPSALPVGA